MEGGGAVEGGAAGGGEGGAESAVVEEGRVEVEDDADLAARALAGVVSAASGEAADVAGLGDDAAASVAVVVARGGEEVEGAGGVGEAGGVAAESAVAADAVVVAEGAGDVALGGEAHALAGVAPSAGADNINMKIQLFPRSNMCKLLLISSFQL